MNTGAKIAIGCAAAAVLAGVAVVGVIGGGVWFAKKKIDEVGQEQQKITDLQKKANQNPFTAPADGVVSEDRLVKFLAVRKAVYGVYEQHKAEIDALSKKKQGDLSDLRTGYNLLNEMRQTHAQALVDQGMSEGEYTYLVQQIYKTA